METIEDYINEIDRILKKKGQNREKIKELQEQLETEFRDFIDENGHYAEKNELENEFVRTLDKPEDMANALGEIRPYKINFNNIIGKQFLLLYWLFIGIMFIAFFAQEYTINPDPLTNTVGYILYVITGIGVFVYYFSWFYPFLIIFHRTLNRKEFNLIENGIQMIKELIIAYCTVLGIMFIFFFLIVDPKSVYGLDYLGETLVWIIITIIIIILQRENISVILHKQW